MVEPKIKIYLSGEKEGKAAVSGLETALYKEAESDRALSCYATLKNTSSEIIRLHAVSLLQVEDLKALGIGDGPYDFYKSGRHKNELPGVFTFGQKDERFLDLVSRMSESGDKVEIDENVTLMVSDHLSMFAGKDGQVLAVEFMTGRNQLYEARVELDDEANLLSFDARLVFDIELLPGREVRTETMRIAYADDPTEEILTFAKKKAALYNARSTRRPAVYCTWYYYGLTVSYEDVKTNLKAIAEKKLPYEVFQIDEGWSMDLGDYRLNEKFPKPMPELTREIREEGLIPGLWTSPFIAGLKAPVWDEHPDWILRDREGNPCIFMMNRRPHWIFDITIPATWDYFREIFRMFTFDWGFTYHKLDFTRAAVINEQADYFDKTMTRAESYYQAVKAIREGMGEDAFFLMCGGLYDPILGLVDCQRTGSDVLSMWSTGNEKSGSIGGKAAPFTIRQSLMRFYMNHWWANDPDALMIRKNTVEGKGGNLTLGLLTDDEVRTSVVNQFMGGGIMCQTEPLDLIDDVRLAEMRHVLPVQKVSTKVLDLFGADRFPKLVEVDVEKTGAICLALINWDDEKELQVQVSLKNFGLEADEKYAVSEFYSREYRLNVAAEETVSFGVLPPHAATVVKIEKMTDKPMVIASDNHYAMGAELSVLAVEGDSLLLQRPDSPFAANYTILLPAGKTVNGQSTVNVTVEGENAIVQLDK